MTASSNPGVGAPSPGDDGESQRPLHMLTVTEAAARIRGGQLSAVQLVEALVERIDALDPQVRAWVSVDRGEALATARQRDAEARASRLRGPLHGIPVALKDIFHVAGMVTTAGAGPFAHEQPTEDAAAVTLLRAAGAIILGKTTTAEFAFFDPPETRNPWHPDHTPGGSSSGSAAAVAAGMVPLAIGSQTAGSVLRPAAYCGVVGFKPAHGRISCRGMIPLAPGFDHVGTFTRSVADAALVLDVLAGHDPADPWSRPDPPGDYTAVVSSQQEQQAPRLGFVRRPYLDRATPEMAAHLETTADRLARAGAAIEEVDLPGSLEGLFEAGFRVMQVAAAAVHHHRFAHHPDQFRPKIRALIEAGQQVGGVDYVLAGNHCRRFKTDVGPVLARFDALLLPVADSSAPKGLDSTGDPSFCAPWSFTGFPAIALPSGVAGNGLPLAVQVVSGDDCRLLGAAAWCEAALAWSSAPPEIHPLTPSR
jgi:Asp-tRNA(Asn)/Glu-tRNA(Gln) amidotransferase A subunit family amidase